MMLSTNIFKRNWGVAVRPTANNVVVRHRRDERWALADVLRSLHEAAIHGYSPSCDEANRLREATRVGTRSCVVRAERKTRPRYSSDP